MWKALSLLKLERLSVAGWNGTEWMKVSTEGETWKGREREGSITIQFIALRLGTFELLFTSELTEVNET